MNTTASVNANKTEMHSDYQSVDKQTKGENAGAQSLGAMTAEAVGMLSEKLYSKDVSQLTEDEKATVSAFASLAAGIAGGLVGGDTSSAANAAEAGKTTVENNALSSETLGKSDCLTMSPATCGKAKELNQRILDKGLPSVETMRDKLASCQDDACRKAAWMEYRAASDATISTLKEMALSGELSREELAFINHELGKELAVRGYREGGKIGVSENLSWTNNGQGPLTGFFDTELRQKELVNSGMTVADAAQFVEEEKRNIMLLETAAGVIGSKAGNKNQGKSQNSANKDQGKGSAIPVPDKTSASNGLIYQSNGKHTPNQPGYSRDAGTEPKNSIELFGNSIESGKKRYSIDKEGNVHQFTNTNDGSWHWSGSTGDKSVPLKKSEVPNSVRKEFGLPGKWR